MDLFFLRHGKAFERGLKWRPDSVRPLTKEGEKKMFEMAKGARKLGLSFDLILTSPYARALRTAEILAEVFEARNIFESTALGAEADPRLIVKEITESFSNLDSIVLVGHQPFLTRLISTLLCGHDRLPMELRKGGLCKLTIKKLSFGECARLDWLMTARQLRHKGKDA